MEGVAERRIHTGAEPFNYSWDVCRRGRSTVQVPACRSTFIQRWACRWTGIALVGVPVVVQAPVDLSELCGKTRCRGDWSRVPLPWTRIHRARVEFPILVVPTTEGEDTSEMA